METLGRCKTEGVEIGVTLKKEEGREICTEEGVFSLLGYLYGGKTWESGLRPKVSERQYQARERGSESRLGSGPALQGGARVPGQDVLIHDWRTRGFQSGRCSSAKGIQPGFMSWAASCLAHLLSRLLFYCCSLQHKLGVIPVPFLS